MTEEMELTDMELLLVYLRHQDSPQTLEEIEDGIVHGGLKRLPLPFRGIRFSYGTNFEGGGLKSDLYALVGNGSVDMLTEHQLSFQLSDLGGEEYKVIKRVADGYDTVNGKAVRKISESN